MLAIRFNNYELDNMMHYDYRRIDYNQAGSSSVPGVGFIRNKSIDSALAPIAFNGIGILNKTFGLSNLQHFREYEEDIKTVYDNIADTRLGVIRIYTSAVDEIYEALDPDIFTSVPSAIQELYNKCMMQVQLREVLTNNIKTKVKVSRSKHVIVLISNYSDDNQASDYFLTIGLVPIIFQDWKDKFNEEELNYFKVLVNRSQVKRISNVKALEAFDAIQANDKYTKALTELRLKNTVEQIVSGKIRTAQDTLRSAQNRAEQLLNSYREEQTKFYEAHETLTKLESNREESIEELRNACMIEGITDVNMYDRNHMTIDFVVPLSFYNMDEVECVINGMDDNWVKQLFIDVFATQKYKMHIVSRYYFATERGAMFQSPGIVEMQLMQKHNAAFNPHTYFYQCLGDYKPQLINAQTKQDLYMFNTIALASAKSINFRDGAVINRWKDTLMEWSRNNGYAMQEYFNIKCLEDEDGNRHSIKEIYLTPPEDAPELEVRDVE